MENGSDRRHAHLHQGGGVPELYQGRQPARHLGGHGLQTDAAAGGVARHPAAVAHHPSGQPHRSGPVLLPALPRPAGGTGRDPQPADPPQPAAQRHPQALGADGLWLPPPLPRPAAVSPALPRSQARYRVQRPASRAGGRGVRSGAAHRPPQRLLAGGAPACHHSGRALRQLRLSGTQGVAGEARRSQATRLSGLHPDPAGVALQTGKRATEHPATGAAARQQRGGADPRRL